VRFSLRVCPREASVLRDPEEETIPTAETTTDALREETALVVKAATIAPEETRRRAMNNVNA
jgi:hypothetical protein